MALRSGQRIDLAWALLDVKALAYDSRVSSLRTKHETARPMKLSINQSPDGSRALVKVAGADSSWVDTFRPDAVRVFTEADHGDAVKLVQGWDAERAQAEVRR